MTDKHLIQRLLAFVPVISDDIREELAALNLIPEPFPIQHLADLAVILDRYENIQPMRDTEFIAMAKTDISTLSEENERLREFAQATFNHRSRLISDEEFEQSANALQSWLVTNKEGR